MDPAVQNILVFLTGLLAGAVNTLGGGGSSFIYPLLIFMGFSPHQAVGTARPAFLAQGIFSAWGFGRRGYGPVRFGLWMGLAAMWGAVWGARLGLAVPPLMFKRVIALVIAAVSVAVVSVPRLQARGQRPARSLWLNALIFFGLGMYSGFIQTGLGFLILIVLAGFNRLDIHRANSIKALVILLSALPSLWMYARAGQVVWVPSLWLAAGMGAGAYAAGYFSVGLPVRTVRWIISALALLMAVRLWW